MIKIWKQLQNITEVNCKSDKFVYKTQQTHVNCVFIHFQAHYLLMLLAFLIQMILRSNQVKALLSWIFRMHLFE